MYAIYFSVSCALVMLVESMLVFFLDKLIEIPYFALTWLRLLLYTAGVSALVGYLGYKEGYRKPEDDSIVETVLSGLLATLIPHLIFAVLFRYQSFIAGGVRYAVGLILHGKEVTAENMSLSWESFLMFLFVFLAYGLIYVGILTICKHMGAKRRLMDRQDLITHS